MKKIFILLAFLFCFVLEAQQQKPAVSASDSSWNDLKKSMNTLRTEVRVAKKQAVKKVEYFLQRDTVYVLDTTEYADYAEINYADSASIYEIFKQRADSLARQEKKKAGLAKFFESIFNPKKKNATDK